MAEHAILRLDNVQATQDNSLMRSGLFYTVSGNTKTPTDIDNGLPVNVGALVSGERELRELTAGAANSAVLGITSTPELYSFDEIYDGTNLIDFYNRAGNAVRVHLLQAGDIFSVSAHAITGTAPTVGALIGIDGGKWKVVESSGLLTCIQIETVSGTTLYVFEVNKNVINQ